MTFNDAATWDVTVRYRLRQVKAPGIRPGER
jgi:hypothetical protein